MEKIIDRFGGVPPHLEVGDLWRNKRYGTFVVVGQEPSRWRGEDCDVYSHVESTYTLRPATTEEIAIYDDVVNAYKAREAMRKTISGVGGSHSYCAERHALVPSDASTRRLDSYDDRWEPPQPIELTPEQDAIEAAYVSAAAKCKCHPV